MSSFTSIMKAIGSGIVRIFASPAAEVVANTLGAIFPAAAPFEKEVISIVGSVEQVSASLSTGALSGTQKAQAALPLVIEALKASNLVAGKEIADPDQFQKAAQSFIDGTVALLNSLKHS